MKPLAEYLDRRELADLVGRALAEDVGAGDVTTVSLVPAEARAEARIVAKADGVLAGMAFVNAVFARFDAGVKVEWFRAEGAVLRRGDTVCRLSGNARALLTGERTALNFLGHLSGIATRAARFASLVAGTKLAILDTRKTTPGLRQAEKYAVQAGGCRNHRSGLYDMVLIKENHVRAAGGITAAVTRARAAADGLAVEVETTNEAEVREALAAGADRIMLDNMDDDLIRAMLAIIDGRAETEASGNMDEARIARLAASGLDFISVGALTHSVTALDLSLLFEKNA